jgi:hypothetical protein
MRVARPSHLVILCVCVGGGGGGGGEGVSDHLGHMGDSVPHVG